MIYKNTLYLSRTAIEEWGCPYEFNYRYLYNGTGVVSAKPIRALELGIAAHKACEFMLHRMWEDQLARKNGQPIPQRTDTSNEVWSLIAKYLGDRFKPHIVHDDQAWTLRNDVCLIYGLVMLFKNTILEDLEREMREDGTEIVFVEQEMSTEWRSEGFTTADADLRYRDDIVVRTVFEGRPDWATYNPKTGDFILWNLKTSKHSLDEDNRIDRSYSHDLQGLLEAWLTEEGLKVPFEMYRNMPPWQMLRVKLDGLPEKVNAIRYAFLIKGKDESKKGVDGNFNGKVITYSPVVRGYRNNQINPPKYAWDNTVEKPENTSGWGRLGKEWEAITVWECMDLGANPKQRMDKWVTMLLDPLGNDFIPVDRAPNLVQVPMDKFRTEGDIQQAVEDVKTISDLIMRGVKWKDRTRCTYPQRCEYFGPCREGKDMQELISIGEFVPRVPHHFKEGAAAIAYQKENQSQT